MKNLTLIFLASACITAFPNLAFSSTCGLSKSTVCIEKPCPTINSVTHIPAKQDPLRLGVSTLRLTEISDGPNGTFKIEGLVKNEAVIGLEWTYAIGKGTERRVVSGFHTTSYSAPMTAALLYDGNGVIRDTITKDSFYTNVLRWLRGTEQLPAPDWSGNYFAGSSLLDLITMPCTSCEGEWCSCSD